MATDVVMPKLGLTMEQGTIAAWLKAEGDAVSKGEALLEVETDKVTMEVEAQTDGVLSRILVAAGEEVDVATPIAIIGAPGEPIDDKTDVKPSVNVSTGPGGSPVGQGTVESPIPAAHAASSIPTSSKPHRASPKARKMAAVHAIDLSGIVGSGPGGRIVSADVEPLLVATASRPAPSSGLPTDKSATVPLNRAQQIAAQRLTRSYQEAPHIQLQIEVAAHWLEQFRGGFAAEGRKISYNDLILRGVALSLRQHPRLNSTFSDGALLQAENVDLGIATDTAAGLVVPVLRDVGHLSIEEISAASRRLVDLARDGRLGVDEMTGGTFTITNLGMFGVSSFSAIINPPQVAILAVGAVERRVVPIDDVGGMGVRPMLTLNLAADHRAIDGAMGARFLQHLRDTLQSPALLA